MKTILLAFFLVNVFSCMGAEKEKNPLSFLAVEESAEDREALSIMKTRRQMLNWHNYTAWASVGLMGLTLATAPEGDYDETHKWLGIASGISYFVSASLAALAPRPGEIKQSKNILIHKKLIWIHAPAMVLTIYSGIKAHQQRKDDEKLGSIAKLHSAFAAITAISFGFATISSMDWSLSLLPANKRDIACVFTKRF